MKKKYSVRVKLKALLEMFAQNRFAMWQEIDNEKENKCDRCAIKVCPAYVSEEEKIVNEIIHLLIEYTVDTIIAYDNRLKRAKEAAEDFKDEPV